MIGILIQGGSNNSIINCTFEGLETAIQATNTHNLKIDTANVVNCEKGIGLNNCWDSKLNNVTIDQPLVKNSKSNNRFKLTKLTSLIKYYMIHA